VEVARDLSAPDSSGRGCRTGHMGVTKPPLSGTGPEWPTTGGESPVRGRRRPPVRHLSRAGHVKPGSNRRGPSRKAKYSLATDSGPSSASERGPAQTARTRPGGVVGPDNWELPSRPLAEPARNGRPQRVKVPYAARARPPVRHLSRAGSLAMVVQG
jgi:hypothetical protein